MRNQYGLCQQNIAVRDVAVNLPGYDAAVPRLNEKRDHGWQYGDKPTAVSVHRRDAYVGTPSP